MVGQKTPFVERHDRQADDTWPRTDIAWPDGVLTLDSVGISVALREIYRKVFAADHPI